MYKDARKTLFLTNFSEKISLNRFSFRKMTLKIGFIFIFLSETMLNSVLYGRTNKMALEKTLSNSAGWI